MKLRIELALLALLSSCAGAGPGAVPIARSVAPAPTPATASPAPRAPVVDRELLRAYSESRRFTRGTPQGTRLTPDGRYALFLRSGARDKKQSLFETEVSGGRTRELLAPEALDKGAEQLTLEERARRERMRITSVGFTSFLLSEDGATVIVSLSGKLYALDRASGRTHLVDVGPGAAIDPQLSPDGKLLAYVQNDDVQVASVAGTGKARALTKGGTDAKPHGLADFCASEELDRYSGFVWSPDSKAILYEEADASQVEKLTIADPANPGRPADVVAYPRAGHANAVVRFGIVNVASPAATVWVEWDREKMPYVAGVSWEEHAPPTLVVLDRLQKNAAVLLVEPATGKTREAVREHDDAWVNVDPSVPAWLPDGSAFVWMSERDGDRRYERVSAKDPGEVKWLTPAGMQAEEVLDLDGAKGALVFGATRDAVHHDVLRVSLGGGDVETVAHVEGGSVHGHFEKRVHDRFVAREDSLTAVPRAVVRATSGAVLGEVPSVGLAPPLPQVELSTVGADGVRLGLVRPKGFVPGARYPLIDSAYAGPHSNVVSSNALEWVLEQWMADATGAIVVSMDAKGTPGRGRAWERALLGELGNVPLDGHVATIETLLAAHPELDGSRVGVFGWSFGGYFSALAALKRPDVFSAAVAIAPVADWRDYDTAYTERYLGLPDANAAAYDAASVLVAAEKPPAAREAALLLIHGTADDNVYFLNTLKAADALTRSGHAFHLLPLVGQTHQVASAEDFAALWLQAARTLREGLGR